MLAAALSGQEPVVSSARVVADLGSDGDRAVAWAAHRARGLKDRESRHALARALRRWATKKWGEADLVRLQLLDALIARHVKVPGDLIVPMLEERTTATAAFILLCRQPRMNELQLMRLMVEGELDDIHRVALGNLLAANKVPRFAVWLWSHAPTHLVIKVCSPGEAATFFLGRPERHPGPAVLSGFPPPPDYRLLPHTEAEATSGNRPSVSLPKTELLAPGRDSIGFVRILDPGQSEPSLRARCGVTPDEHWLAQMAGLATARPSRVWLTYRDSETFGVEAARLRNEYFEYKSDLRDALFARAALTSTEASACSLAVEVRVSDQRNDRSEPLPAVPACWPEGDEPSR